jgi:transposase
VGLPLLYEEKAQMTHNDEVFIGIDVGKKWLDIAILGNAQTSRKPNDAAGVAELLMDLSKLKPTLVVIEASGGYEQLTAQTLLVQGFPVAVVNPTRVRALAKAMGLLAKTDKIDAHLLAEYAYRIRPVPKEVQEERAIQLKALVSRREQLVEMCTAEQSRLGTTYSGTKEDVREHILWLQTRIQQLEDEIRILATQLPEWEQQAQLLDTIPGVAFITAITVVTEMPELGQLDRQKIAALAGLSFCYSS